MILHYVALALLLVVPAYYVISGDLTRWLLKAAQKDDVGNQLHSAVVAMFFVSLLYFGGFAALLLVPETPEELEIGLGAVIVFGVSVLAIWKRSFAPRPFLMVASGMLILAGNYI